MKIRNILLAAIVGFGLVLTFTANTRGSKEPFSIPESRAKWEERNKNESN